MKILHISDTHGSFPELKGDFDLVVHSGDILPNWSFANRLLEEPRQTYWVQENRQRFVDWLSGKPMLFCTGNHDFIEPEIPGAGCLDNRAVDFEGLTFYGFPWVPQFVGWAHELDARAMEWAVDNMIERCPRPDVLVAHCPLYGVLDINSHGERCGNKELLAAFREGWAPRYLLNGHIHERGGRYFRWRDTFVSNAATAQRIIEV